jgi:hypothetical protein
VRGDAGGLIDDEDLVHGTRFMDLTCLGGVAINSCAKIFC